MQLYTDRVPNEFYSSELRAQFGSDTVRQKTDAKLVNDAFLKKAFNTAQLPLYVVLEPNIDERIDVIGIYAEGRIIDVKGFAEFLQNPK